LTTGEKRRHRAQVDDRAHLWPKHREVLRSYGLNDDTIDAWGCFTAAQEHLAEFARGVHAPGIALPILPPGTRKSRGFLYRPDQPRVFEKNGKRRRAKYEHAVKATNHIHVPQSVHARLAAKGEERVKVLVISEGPIKAEVAAQDGIDCVALPGVWNWRQRFGDESVPIEDLIKLPWAEFDHVEICFDSDAATNPNVRKAERALGGWLLNHGAAKILIVRLPSEGDGSKVGLDDYLRVHSAEEYEKLARFALDAEPPLEDMVSKLTAAIGKAERNRTLGRILDEEHDPGEQERLLKLAAHRTGITLRALRASAQAEARQKLHGATQTKPLSRRYRLSKRERPRRSVRQQSRAF
jgi:hypothetical protein